VVANWEKLERPTTRAGTPHTTLRERLVTTFQRTRAETERLAAPLSPEDQMMQARPEASPTKWHRAHTTWFWEQFLLAPFGIAPVDERWVPLFNSYYESVAQRHGAPAARNMRGVLSRPSCEAVAQYRRVVDDRVVALLSRLDEAALDEARVVVELGVAHEEQHQELILTDILAAFAESPLRPQYAPQRPTIALAPALAPPPVESTRAGRTLHAGGLVEVGAPASGFAFDCERPRHRVWLEPFALADAPISVGEVKAFIEARGYHTPSLWLSDGWAWLRQHDVRAPGYARVDGGALVVFTLHGERVAHDDEPASHLSYFEADAIARFLGGRLPTEQEHEHATSSMCALRGHRDDGALVPGRVWEWTSSSFTAYPGYVATDGATRGSGAWGEYNGKFMHGQMVLRGGSCFTNRAHMRPSTRNFWPSPTRFQMTGARVAFDARAGDGRDGRQDGGPQ
jgi:ergothioneine biosynthesis protein EgtB